MCPKLYLTVRTDWQHLYEEFFHKIWYIDIQLSQARHSGEESGEQRTTNPAGDEGQKQVSEADEEFSTSVQHLIATAMEVQNTGKYLSILTP